MSSENSDVWAAYDHFNLMSWRPKQKLSNYQDLWEFKGVIISVFIERAILFALQQNLLRRMVQAPASVDTAVADAMCFHCTGEQLLSDLSLNLFPDNTDNPHASFLGHLLLCIGPVSDQRGIVYSVKCF